MQFLAQEDPGGWFLAAGRNPWKTPYWLSKSIPGAQETQNDWEVPSGLGDEMGQGSY